MSGFVSAPDMTPAGAAGNGRHKIPRFRVGCRKDTLCQFACYEGSCPLRRKWRAVVSETESERLDLPKEAFRHLGFTDAARQFRSSRE
jgi:hypothetical protein